MFKDFGLFDMVTVQVKDGDLQYKFILPGIEKQNITISITNHNLNVSTKEKTAFGEIFHYEDTWKYDKYFKIDQAKATLENGVLTITIPKKVQIPSKEEVNYIQIE